MRIAFFTDTYHPNLNGVTVSLDHFTKELEKKGHTVIIYAPKVKGYKEVNKNIIRISSFIVLSSEPEIRLPLPTSGSAMKEIANENFDIVHAHGNGAFSLLGYQVARIKGVPYILTFHNLHTKYTHYFLKGKVVKPRMIATGMRVFANICDAIIVPSKKMQLELQSYGVKKDIRVIPNFVPIEKFQVKNTNFLHNQLSLPPTTPLILSVGRLGIEKNFSFLINAFSKIAKKNSVVDLVIVGRGPEEEHLRALAAKLALSERIHFIDTIDPSLMPQAYQDAVLFAFSSESETQGVCVLEAASSGLPIVVVNDLAYDRMVVDGVNGYSVPLSIPAFSEAILKILSDRDLQEKMGKASREIAIDNFEGGKITEELIAIYENVLARHKVSRKIIKKVNKVALARIIQMKRGIDRMLN